MQVADASQQEMWFLASLSQDCVLLDELQSGVDRYQVAADLFGVNRKKGKAIELGLNYGMSEYGLAAQVGITTDKARAGIVARDRRYRQATAWKGQRKNEARRFYKVHSITGRPVWINPYDKQWERNAINAPIQASAAGHTKTALVNIHRACNEAGLQFRVVNVVHDEILQDVPVAQKDIYAAILKKAWDDASAKLAPGMAMRADVLEGQTWSVKE
jgi:DNA polymerase-1